jgi:hypothetical protein
MPSTTTADWKTFLYDEVLDLDNGASIGSSIFRAWWFDPAIASLSFITFINLYWHYERKFNLTAYTISVIEVGLSLSPDIQSAILYWAGIVVIKFGVGVPQPANMRDGIPSSLEELLYLGLEVVVGIVAYDAIFFVLHWAMHEVPALRWIHARHHQTSNVSAVKASGSSSSNEKHSTKQAPVVLLECNDVLRHSLLDGLLQVSVNILVQRTTPWGRTKSRCARMLHNIIAVWMLTESHTLAPYPNIWRQYFVGVREHAAHHDAGASMHKAKYDQGTSNDEQQSIGGRVKPLRYQQFFGYLDALRIHYIVRRQRKKL